MGGPSLERIFHYRKNIPSIVAPPIRPLQMKTGRYEPEDPKGFAFLGLWSFRIIRIIIACKRCRLGTALLLLSAEIHAAELFFTPCVTDQPRNRMWGIQPVTNNPWRIPYTIDQNLLSYIIRIRLHGAKDEELQSHTPKGSENASTSFI